MHFDLLVEDKSGKKSLDILLPRIIGTEHTYKVIAYKGVGRIPRNMKNPEDASKRILLENLPKLLRGYGKTYAGYGKYKAAVIVVCDLDKKCLRAFKKELIKIHDACVPKPLARFCFAIEEGEAWFLGDINAIEKAYPDYDGKIISSYVNDSICDTWELLADAIYPGGARKLKEMGWQTIGAEKSIWAEKIAPHMSLDKNKSPSFCYFRNKLTELL
ncbi:MAG: hypothetical protein JNL74_00825 [Fibrobacteres bacterium]|nr:hypothetical protein [Fibrobacterota bacterium]